MVCLSLFSHSTPEGTDIPSKPTLYAKTLMTMAEISEEAESQTVEGSIPSPLLPSKRKPDAEFSEEGEGEPEKKLKHQKPEIASGPVPQPQEAANNEGGSNEETMADPNGAVKSKGALTAVDKGKGILMEEEEEDDDSDGGDENSGRDSDDEVGGEEDDDSDFVDDPLAEIDLDNILPPRTRRREPPPPGSYFDPDQDGDDSDDSEV